MKNELIKTDVVSGSELNKMVSVALEFYKKYFTANILDTINTSSGVDIILKGEQDYELGSYGIRDCEFLEWIYGTGCAEPRLSNLIKNYGISSKSNH